MGAIQQVLLGGSPDNSLHGIISATGLTTNLVLCLDAADINSWPGSGTKWKDTSGQGNDVFLGTDGTTNAPTFNGTPGNLSSNEYWASNGGFFTAVTQVAAFNNLHKSGAAWTALSIMMLANTGTEQAAAGDGGSGTGPGVACYSSTTFKQLVDVSNGSGNAARLGVADNAMTTAAWHLLGQSITDGGGNVSFLYRDGAYDPVSASNTSTIAYSSPSASASLNTFQIVANGGNARPFLTGARFACFALWSGTMLSKTQLDSIYNSIKAKRSYGI